MSAIHIRKWQIDLWLAWSFVAILKTVHFQTVNRWHSPPGYSEMYQSPGKKIDFVSEWQSTRATSERESFFFFLFVHCPLSAAATIYSEPFLFLSFFVWACTDKLHSSLLLLARPNLASCFGLDELVAQWNKPVCLLYKPVFQAYTLWRLYMDCKKKKKKVISAAAWIRKGWRKKKPQQVISAPV